MKVAYCPKCLTVKLTNDVEGQNRCPKCHEKFIFTDESAHVWYLMTPDEKQKKMKLWFGGEDTTKIVDNTNIQDSDTSSNLGIEKELNPSFWMTGGLSFEGFRITRYLGIHSGNYVLVKGTYPDMQAVSDDVSGLSAARLSDSIEKAKIQALCKLQDNCIESGANAAISVKTQITSIGDVITVCADGTAVCIEL